MIVVMLPCFLLAMIGSQLERHSDKVYPTDCPENCSTLEKEVSQENEKQEMTHGSDI